MKVKVMETYDGYGGNRPIFPTFEKGTPVEITGNMDKDFAHWYPCLINGYETFVPSHFVENGLLTREYNPTELSQTIGDLLVVEILTSQEQSP